MSGEQRHWLVDWWDIGLYYEREAREIDRQRGAASPELLAMYNRPQSVIDLQALHDRVYALMGVT